MITSRDPLQYTPEQIGRKAYNLFKLVELSEELGFKVPPFTVIPTNWIHNDAEMAEFYHALPKPLAVRSSSPYEDSKEASFAGRFTSVIGVSDYTNFCFTVMDVRKSAHSDSVRSYARDRNITIDDRIAVIVQEMVEPKFAGAAYSTLNRENPMTMLEFVLGTTADNLMSGKQNGNFLGFDPNLETALNKGPLGEYPLSKSDYDSLRNVTRIMRELEKRFGERLDIEFAVSMEGEVYILQKRPVIEPDWPIITAPGIEKERIIFEADVVRGAGDFTGPVFVINNYDYFLVNLSRTEGMAPFHGRMITLERRKYLDSLAKLKAFDKSNPAGYCLITESLQGHRVLTEGLSNVRVIITADYASRFSHPVKVATEKNAFYLGAYGMNHVLSQMETGDIISVISDQSQGLIYNLQKQEKEVVRREIDFSEYEQISLEKGFAMHNPHYDLVDDRFFQESEGCGVIFWDYNHTEDERRVPTYVCYELVVDGAGCGSQGYDIAEMIVPCLTFSDLLEMIALRLEATKEQRRKKT